MTARIDSKLEGLLRRHLEKLYGDSYARSRVEPVEELNLLIDDFEIEGLKEKYPVALTFLRRENALDKSS